MYLLVGLFACACFHMCSHKSLCVYDKASLFALRISRVDLASDLDLTLFGNMPLQMC